MNQARNLVPIVPTSIEQVQQVQNIGAGTNTGTAVGTGSLKSLAIKQLQEPRQVQPQVQEQVQADSPCTYPAVATGTVSSSDTDAPTPEQVAHMQRMLVDCPNTPGVKWHCWYCSRCDRADKCGAWRHLAADVKWFKLSGPPYSLLLAESLRDGVEVIQ